MNTIYKILFSIELQHDYYNQQESFNDIEIIPTEQTKKIMNGYRILYKVFSNKLVALVEVDGAGKPFVTIDKNTTLRFLLKLNNLSFLNISALKVFNNGNKIYYFTNGADNKTLDGILYLSKQIPAFRPGEDYEVGSLLKDALDNIYEAIQHNTSAPPNSFWRQLTPKRFPEYGIKDHPDIYKGNIFYITPKLYQANKFIPKDFSININDINYLKAITALQYVSDDLIDKDFINIVKYDTNNHPDIFEGNILANDTGTSLRKAKKFIAKGNAVDFLNNVFWDNVIADRFVISDDSVDFKKNIFGVIDLFFNGVTSDYLMLDVSGKVKEINYVIRFKNRITTWKYISSKNNTISIKDQKNIFSFGAPGSSVSSIEPIPLHAKPTYDFKATSNNLSTTDIKCASSYIKPDFNTKSFLSEIFLNY